MRTNRIFIGWVMSIVWFLGISTGYAQTPTVDLTTHQPTAAPPAGATFEWHNGFPVSAANLMTNTQTAVAVPGVYYGVYNFGTCYSQASPLRVATNSCPITTVDLRAFVDSTAKPFGTIVTFHSALPASSVNRLTASAVTTAGAGTFYVAFYDPVALCFSSASVIVVASTSCVINYPPVVVVPPIVTKPGVAKTVCGEINDPNVGDTHTVTVCGAASKGTTVQTVNNQTGKLCITYTPNVGQTGVDNVCLVVCDQGGLCDTVRVPITIVPEIPTSPTNQPPVVVVTPIITVQDSTTTTCMPILDPNGLGTNSFIVCGAPKHGTANPITTVGGQLCITYTPSSGYFGRDSICVIVCDNGSPSLCDTVSIPITVYPRVQVPTIPQSPIVSLPPIVTKEGVPVSICGPISDPNGGDTHTVTQCNVPLKGSVSGLSVNNSSHEVCLTYTPQAGQTGNDKVCLTICDQGNLCVTVEVPVTIIPSNFPPANYPPVVVVPPIVTKPGVAKTVCGEINDPNVGDTHTVTVCGAASKGTTVQTVNNQTGKLCISYTPNVGQTGVDNVCLVVCDLGGLCDTVRVPITIVPEIPTSPTNQPPVVVVTPIITVQDSTTTTCMPILDPNGLGTNSFIVCGAPKHGTANPITTVGGQLCITYTPSSGYFGRDSICVIVCDNGSPSLCDTVSIPITVYPRVQVPTIPQAPIVSLPPIVTKEGVPVSICGPISDPNSGDTHTVTQCNVPLKGSVSGLSVNNSSHEVCLTYTPQAGQTGNDKVCLTICDQGNLCVTVEVPVTIIPSNFPPACLTMELKVLLEGPFNPSTSKMETTLNQRGLLPGQTPIGDFAVATPKGQPYNDVPWNYTGTEGHASGFIYPNTVVDWVLVSLRTDSVSVSNVWKGAGLLHDDGTITFIQPCYTINTTASALFVVVEHRNHLGVMSPTKVPIVAGKISFDFTQQDSYVTTDPPSFGQIKDATTNKWLMYAADGNKDDFFENFDINFNDSNRWKLESGIFDQYKKGDYNMDADVNFSDSVLWKKNNGRYSRTPH